MTNHVAEGTMHPLKREHYTCEDCWYSCPLSEDGCCDGRSRGCNCGADEHNKKVDELLAYVRYMEGVLNWDAKALEHLAHKPKWLSD